MEVLISLHYIYGTSVLLNSLYDLHLQKNEKNLKMQLMLYLPQDIHPKFSEQL